MDILKKDPDATLDFALDWSRWLLPGDSIATATWTIPTGITQATPAPSILASKTIIWLSGGTLSQVYTLRCRIVTAQDRVDERSLVIRITKR